MYNENEQKKNVDYDLNDDSKQRKKKTALVGVGSALAGVGSGGAIYFANKRRNNKAAILAKANEGAISIQKLNSSVGSAPVEIIEEAPVETITEVPADIIANAVSEEPTEFEILDLSDGGSTSVEISSSGSIPKSGIGSLSSSKSKEKTAKATTAQKEETIVQEKEILAEEVKEEVTSVPAQTVTEEVISKAPDTTSDIGVATPIGTYNLSLSFDEINNLISKVVVMSNIVTAAATGLIAARDILGKK